LENELSRFLPNSDVSRINHLQPGHCIVVSPDIMECLKSCFALYLETQGAFDITVGALHQCWLNRDNSLRQPSSEEIQAAGLKTGMQHLFFDQDTFTVTTDVTCLQIDLGGFGKGYAVDRMAAVLKEWEIDAALIHGGTSSVYAWGGEEGWLATISHPLNHAQILRRLSLQDMAMAGSGLQKGFHIIDPVHGRPVQHHLAAWVMAPDAAASDALSTAFMVMTAAQVAAYCRQHPQVAAALLPASEGNSSLLTFGFESPA